MLAMPPNVTDYHHGAWWVSAVRAKQAFFKMTYDPALEFVE